jgi:N-ethylmaleimide reductase
MALSHQSQVSGLFSPGRLGDLALSNRVVLAPMTRNRADDAGVPATTTPLYYAQRSGAGLIVSEGVCISPTAACDRRLPGIWTEEQIAGWRSVTAAVRRSGGTIVAQLWHTGRASHPALQPESLDALAPSAIAIEGTRVIDGEIVPCAVPREATLDDIRIIVADYARAARNAIRAGFDGVEIHGANGYLIDQFLQDGSNRRADGYGGSVHSRFRFLDEVLDAVIGEVGAGRVGLRISPASTWQSMSDSDPENLWGHVVAQVEPRRLAFLHLVEPGIGGNASETRIADSIDSAWVRARYSGRLVATGRYGRESAEAALAAGTVDAVGFGRLFTSNPDLAERMRTGAPITPTNRPTYYQGDDVGYIDWPSLEAEDILRQLESGILQPDGLELQGAGDWPAPAENAHQWAAAWALWRFRGGETTTEHILSSRQS